MREHVRSKEERLIIKLSMAAKPMEPKVIKQGILSSVDANIGCELKTQFFADGSAIVVTEKGILLVESTAEYKVDSIAGPALKFVE